MPVIGLVLAVSAGLAWPLAFAPTGWWWLAPLILVLIQQLVQAAPARVVRLGAAFGMALFVSGIHWLFISLHTYGAMPWPIAGGGVLLLSAYLALYPLAAVWLHAWIWRRWQPGPAVAAMSWASCWTVTEQARGWVFTGFPWLASTEIFPGSFVENALPWTGGTGLSWCVVAASACLIAHGIDYFRKTPRPGWRRDAPAAGCLAMIAAVLTVVSGVPLDTGVSSAGHVRVAIVQPNIAQEVKFDGAKIAENVRQTYDLARQAASRLQHGDWLMLPETAIPLLWHDAPVHWRDAFQGLAHEFNVWVVMGAALDDHSRFTNSVIALDPADNRAPDIPPVRYDKRHLVPFGEFIPLGFRWFVDLMNMPLGDFNRGEGRARAFRLGAQYLLPNVCYEDVFGREFAELVAASEPQPNVLVNVSNLAWFGKSRAMEQHAQMSRTRALELGRPMIRATNTGLSGVIGAEGQWLLRLSTNEPEIGLVSVPVTRGLTFYARHPDALWRAALVLTACWLLLAVWLAKRRARYNSTLAAIPPRPPADYHET